MNHMQNQVDALNIILMRTLEVGLNKSEYIMMLIQSKCFLVLKPCTSWMLRKQQQNVLNCFYFMPYASLNSFLP
jgi:hypothetical protein